MAQYWTVYNPFIYLLCTRASYRGMSDLTHWLFSLLPSDSHFLLVLVQISLSGPGEIISIKERFYYNKNKVTREKNV